MKSKKRAIKKVFLILLIMLITLLITLTISFLTVYFSAKFDEKAMISERARVKILDINGEEIDKEYFNRYVKYEDINTNIINAFVALEDKRFFKHKGVDYYRTAGALINNIKSGYAKEGGSTITQQLAKNTLLSNEKTLVRKIKEMKLAKDIERKYSKEEILEMYLNAIYYGNGIYGIDSACKNYFGKSPADISLSESAILAGIVKSPQKYSPKNDPEKAYSRMRLVLKLMKEQKYIDEQEYNSAQNYTYEDRSDKKNSPYISAVIYEACKELNKTELELLRSPVSISTFYDNKLQKNVINEYESNNYQVLTKSGERSLSYTAIADNYTGGICAYHTIGDVSVDMRRQPGSIIKPILVYCPALNNHTITPADLYYDEKKDFSGYSPSNYRDVYYGSVDVATALKKSINSVAVEIYQKADPRYCQDLASKAGLTFDKNDDNLSLALGGMTYGSTVKEILSSYMTLADKGNKKSIGFIEDIIDENGRTLYHKKESSERVYTEEAAYLTTEMLVETALDGTASKMKRLKYPIAAKTGTVEGLGGNNSDAWSVSYTEKYTSCVWFGGKDYTESQTIETTGGGIPTLLNANIFSKIEDPGKGFNKPKSIIDLEIDTFAREKDKKIYLANNNTPNIYRKKYYFDINDRPDSYSPYFIIDSDKIEFEWLENDLLIKYAVDYPYSYRLYYEMDDQKIDIVRYNTTINDIFNNEKMIIYAPNVELDKIFMEIRYQDETIGIGVCEIIKQKNY